MLKIPPVNLFTRITLFCLLLSTNQLFADPVEYTFITSSSLINKAFFGSDQGADINDIFWQDGATSNNVNDTNLASFPSLPLGANTIGAASFYISHIHDGNFDGIFSNASNLFNDSFWSLGWVQGNNIGIDGQTTLGTNTTSSILRQSEVYNFENGLQPASDVDGVFNPDMIILDPNNPDSTTTFNADNTFTTTGFSAVLLSEDPNGYGDSSISDTIAGWYLLQGQSANDVIPAFEDINLGFHNNN